METRANHVLIGVFTIAGHPAGASSSPCGRPTTRPTATGTSTTWSSSEAVTGLGTGGIVQYNGINVGEVHAAVARSEGSARVIARIRLAADTPVKIDTKAKLAFIGLTGVAQIQLSGGLPESPRLLPTPDRRCRCIPTRPRRCRTSSAAANDIVERMRGILSDENIARISGTLDDIHQISSTVAGEKDDIAALIKNLREVSAQLNTTLVKAQGSLDTIDRNVVQNLPETDAKLDRTLASLESASKNANGVISDNRQAIASFSQNGLAQVGPTLAELRVLVRDLRVVASRLDRNPGGYVTGRSSPEEFEPQ